MVFDVINLQVTLDYFEWVSTPEPPTFRHLLLQLVLCEFI